MKETKKVYFEELGVLAEVTIELDPCSMNVKTSIGTTVNPDPKELPEKPIE